LKPAHPCGNPLMFSACSDGAEALQQIEKQKFGLIITDLRLPKFNGDELIRRMAAGKGLNRRTPVVLTSGYFTEFGDGRASLGDKHSEASIYLLPKPFKRHELVAVAAHDKNNFYKTIYYPHDPPPPTATNENHQGKKKQRRTMERCCIENLKRNG
jgi:CheY-like chemotaxis protein